MFFAKVETETIQTKVRIWRVGILTTFGKINPFWKRETARSRRPFVEVQKYACDLKTLNILLQLHLKPIFNYWYYFLSYKENSKIISEYKDWFRIWWFQHFSNRRHGMESMRWCKRRFVCYHQLHDYSLLLYTISIQIFFQMDVSNGSLEYSNTQTHTHTHRHRLTHTHKHWDTLNRNNMKKMVIIGIWLHIILIITEADITLWRRRENICSRKQCKAIKI